jgi:hypothetical protein
MSALSTPLHIVFNHVSCLTKQVKAKIKIYIDMDEHLYKSSAKTFDLMGRSTNPGENLKTNPHLILFDFIRIWNLHL